VPTHQAVIVAFDPETGEPQALLDGTAITAIRTGAGSALSVRLLAREDASILAVLGSGVQARSHARAFARVRSLRGILVAARDRGRAQTLAAELARELGVDARAVSDYEEAVRGADLVAATTHSPEPVVQREWLTPGAHITSVGVNPHGRELAGEVVCDALVVVESRAAALAPFPGSSNDLLWPIRDGLIDEAHIHAELGEIVAGSSPAARARSRSRSTSPSTSPSRTLRPPPSFSATRRDCRQSPSEPELPVRALARPVVDAA